MRHKLDQIVSAIKHQSDEAPAQMMQRLGFSQLHTGGGVNVWHYFDTVTDECLIVCDAAGDGLPDTMGEAMVKHLDRNGDELFSYPSE